MTAYTCYTCARCDELVSKLEHGDRPPKECKKCAWNHLGDELPLKKRPNYIEIKF